MTPPETGGLPSPLSGDGNLAALVPAAAKRWPERTAITHEGRGMSFAEADLLSGRAASLLRSRGVERGDRVVLQLPNVPAFVAFYYGILRLGGTVVPINPLLRRAETLYSLEDSQARLLVATEAAADQLGTAEIEVVSVADDWAEVLLAGLEPRAEVVEVDPEDTAVILYTSGTTGRPKGAELTHRNLGLNVREVVRALSLEEGDVFLGTLPLYHSYGQTCTLNATFTVGARLALLTRFEAHAAIDLIEGEAVTVLMAVPTMFAAIAAAAESHDQFASLRLCISGGAPLPREQMEAFRRATGATVLESYGLSETSPGTTVNRLGGESRVGSVGKPIGGVEIAIFDEDGAEVPRGETGQIAIRGHNVMKGYWRREEETREAITEDGWFLTGDLGRIDEDGFVYVVGRIKEMILRGGLNVYPREVEELLHQHPAVSEVAVVGFADERLGEEIGAAVVADPAAALDPAELRAWARERLAPYKSPRRIWTVDELPKGPTGKILKREIRVPEAEASR